MCWFKIIFYLFLIYRDLCSLRSYLLDFKGKLPSYFTDIFPFQNSNLLFKEARKKNAILNRLCVKFLSASHDLENRVMLELQRENLIKKEILCNQFARLYCLNTNILSSTIPFLLLQIIQMRLILLRKYGDECCQEINCFVSGLLQCSYRLQPGLHEAERIEFLCVNHNKSFFSDLCHISLT